MFQASAAWRRPWGFFYCSGRFSRTLAGVAYYHGVWFLRPGCQLRKRKAPLIFATCSSGPVPKSF